MQHGSAFMKVLTVTGLILVSLPVVAPLLFTGVRLVQAGDLRFDYLMPAELFPMALVGTALLLWAALRMHEHRAQIGWSIGAMVVGLVGSQGAAVLTGLASGETEAEGWPLVPVIALLILYVLGLLAMVVTGAQLVREAFDSGHMLPTGSARPQT